MRLGYQLASSQTFFWLIKQSLLPSEERERLRDDPKESLRGGSLLARSPGLATGLSGSGCHKSGNGMETIILGSLVSCHRSSEFIL